MAKPSAGPTARELSPEAWASQRAARRQRLTALLDPTVGHGLEIGPLDRPFTSRDTDDVHYLDVRDQAGLRAYYAHDPNVVLEDIPEIDAWLVREDGTVSLSEAVAGGAPYDWVFASHVIEHVPDLVGWLREISLVTSPEAQLALAIPDRRYCFDRLRPPTTVGQLVAAHESGFTAPDVRAVYDHFSAHVTVRTGELHRGARPPGREERAYGPDWAHRALERVRAGEYVDAHVWLFTPSTLVEQIAELRGIGLIDWYVETLRPTSPGALEFYAVLRRVPTDGSGFDEVPPQSDLPDWLHDEWTAADALRQARAENRKQAKRIASLEKRIAALESSTSWRIGQSVTRPAAAVRRRLRRS